MNSYFTQNIISVWHWSICIRYKSFCRQKIFFNIKNDHCSMEIYLKWNIWGVQPSKYRLCMPNQPCYVPVWHMHLETSSLSYKCNTQNKVHKFICWKFWQQQYYMYGIFILQKSMLHIYYVVVCPNFSFWQNYLMILICSLCYDYLIGHDDFTFLIFPFKWPSPILLQKKIFS